MMPTSRGRMTILNNILHFISFNNGRTLRTDGLQDVLKVIKESNVNRQGLLINVLPNLPTLIDENIKYLAAHTSSDLVQKQKSDYHSDFKYFLQLNYSEEELQYRNEVLETYIESFDENPSEFLSSDVNLSPLSKMIAPMFDKLSNERILKVLDILGSSDIDNYHPNFILKLCSFSNQLDYEKYEKENKEFISALAKRWPKFIHNNALMLSMLKIKKKARVQETKELVDILSDKLLLYPEIMQKHYKSLFLMKNKEQLTEYLLNFIKKASVLGYTDVDLKRLVMALRLIHPNPEDVDTQITLDL